MTVARFIAVFFALLAATVPAKSQSPAGAPALVTLLSCPLGCGLLEGNTMFSNLLARKGENLSIAAQETPGFIYNIREMADSKHWKRSIFGTDDWLIQLAPQGGKPAIKEFLPDPVPIRFKLLHGDAYWPQGKFFVTTNPNIKTLADAKGKRISLGLRGQSNWGTAPRLLLEIGYGITPKNSDIRHMTPSQITQQLIDGATDVIVTGFGTEPSGKRNLIPGPLRQLEASGRKIYYLAADEAAIQRVNKALGLTWIMIKVPAGTLPQQDKDMNVGASRGYKAAHADLPDDVAYRWVMLTHKYMEEMGKVDGLFGLLSSELMVDGLTEENTHPGAIRAFRELGIWDRRLKSTPVTYPAS